MTNLHYFVFLFLLIGSTWCIPHHTADHANHCHVEGDKGIIHIEVGESASVPGKCRKVTCEKDFSLSALTCAAFQPSSGCKLSEIDYSKPYPDCCPIEICAKKH